MLYSPGAVEYSASDYQHIKPVKSPENFPSICVSKSSHQRPKSQYSVLNNEHLYSRHTFFENLSEASYDPFRASREPIVNASNNYMNVTVHRSSSSGSKKLNPRLSSSRKPSSLRVEALRKTSREGSELSAASTLTRGLPSRRISSSHRSSMSRTSMHSGQWLSSPPIAVIRPSNVHKRAVNFSHFRKSSTTGGLPSRAGPDRVARMPDQRPHLHQMRHSSGGNLTVPSSSPQHEVIAPVACEKGNALFVQPTPRTKKMKDIEHEARKVSVELEKVCEEAFFRSSITLSNRSSMTERPNSFSTPPSSVSNRSEQVRSKLHFTDKSTPVDRPLPTIPVSASSSSAETPRTFTARELAEVRDRLARTYAEKGVSSEKAFHDLLNQLDNLFPFDARRSTDGTRSSSAPCSSHPSSRYSPDTNNLLHVIPEEGRFADAEVEISHHERKNPSRRVATAPWSRRYDFSVDTTNNPTVRFVPPSSPPSPPSPTPVAPLNIRKRSNNNNATYKTRSESEAETASQGKFRSNFFFLFLVLIFPNGLTTLQIKSNPPRQRVLRRNPYGGSTTSRGNLRRKMLKLDVTCRIQMIDILGERRGMNGSNASSKSCVTSRSNASYKGNASLSDNGRNRRPVIHLRNMRPLNRSGRRVGSSHSSRRSRPRLMSTNSKVRQHGPYSYALAYEQY